MKINKEKRGKFQVDVKELYTQGYHLYSAGKYKEAEGIFRLLTTQAPKKIEFWMSLASSMQMQKNYQEALDCYGIAALLDTSELNPYAPAHAADCLWAMQEIEKAGIAINSAMIIAKKNSKHHALLEKLQFLHKRWTDE